MPVQPVAGSLESETRSTPRPRPRDLIGRPNSLSGEERPQVVVQEDAVRIEPATHVDERTASGSARGAAPRQEMQLDPVHACVELAEQPIDLPQVRQ